MTTDNKELSKPATPDHDTASFIWAVFLCVCIAMAGARVIDYVKGPRIEECRFEFKTTTGTLVVTHSWPAECKIR